MDGRTGEVRDAVLLVGVPAASNYTYVDVTSSRALPDGTAAHARMFKFFGGVPELVIRCRGAGGRRRSGPGAGPGPQPEEGSPYKRSYGQPEARGQTWDLVCLARNVRFLHVLRAP